MRKVNVAEGIVSLLVDPERASALAGDLMEESVTRSRLWFALALAGTAGTLLGMQFRTDLPDLLKRSALGLLVQYAVLAGLILLSVLAAVPLGLLVMAGAPLTPAGLRASSILFTGASLVFVGRWIARKSPRQEAATCILLIAFSYAVGAGIGWPFFHDAGFSPLGLWGDAGLIFGALSIRWKRVRRAL